MMEAKRSAPDARHAGCVRAWSTWLLALAGGAGPTLAGAESGVSTSPVPHPAGLVHLLVTEHCSATLITERAAVTSAACVLQDAGTTEESPRVHFRQVVDAEGRLIPGRVIPFAQHTHASPERADTGVGDLALVLFDDALPVKGGVTPDRAIPDYRSEWLLVASPDGRRNSYLGERLSYSDVHWRMSAKVYTRDDPLEAPSSRGLVMDRSDPVLRALPVARQQDPDVFDIRALAEAVRKDLGMQLSAEELEDLVMPALSNVTYFCAEWLRKTRPGEWGAGVFAQQDDREVLVGLVGRKQYQIRLSNYWPWIFRTLVKHERIDDALRIADRVLKTSVDRRVADTARCTHTGQIYADKDRADTLLGTLPFHRLVMHQLGREGITPGWGGCEGFANAGRPGSAWEKLGNELPSAVEGRRVIFSWDYDGGYHGKPVIGGYYVYLNPRNAQREYFKLLAVPHDGLLAYFPLDSRGDGYWAYVGNTLPKLREMPLLEAPRALPSRRAAPVGMR